MDSALANAALVAQIDASITNAILIMFSVVSTGLIGAFGWLTKQIADLKTEVHTANEQHEKCEAMHAECERARAADSLKIQRLQLTAELLGQATGTATKVNEVLNPSNPTVKISEQNAKDAR